MLVSGDLPQENPLYGFQQREADWERKPFTPPAERQAAAWVIQEGGW